MQYNVLNKGFHLLPLLICLIQLIYNSSIQNVK